MPTETRSAGPTVTIVAHDVGGVGGMERQLGELVRGLLRAKVPVTVVSRSLDVAPESSLSWHRVRGPARPFPVAYPWFFVAASCAVARRRKHRDILHTTGAIIAQRPDVVTVHYLHHRAGPRLDRASKRSRAFRLSSQISHALAVTAERAVYSTPERSGTLVAVSAALAEELASSYPTRTDDTQVIVNGVDTATFRPDPKLRRAIRSELRIDDSEKLALFIGSEWTSKGLDLIVDALGSVASWRLVVLGSGDATALRARADRIGATERVQLLGRVDDPERYLAGADALVLPSASETFSLVAVEAAAAGVPVIATAVGIVPDLAAHGAAIVIERTAVSVAAALQLLVDEPERHDAMRAAGPTAALRYSWATSIEQYLGLYQALGKSQAESSLTRLRGEGPL